MGDDRMNYNMVCYIERDVFHTISDEDILYRFQAYNSRKGILPRRFGKFLYLYACLTSLLDVLCLFL